MTKNVQTKVVDSSSNSAIAAISNGLAGLAEMTPVQREQALKDYAAKEKARFEQKLAERVKKFGERLNDTSSTAAKMMGFRIQIAQLKSEIKERKDAAKIIRAQIKSFKAEVRAKKAGKVVKAAAPVATPTSAAPVTKK